MSSLEAHSVACGRSTQTSHGCAPHSQSRQQPWLERTESWERASHGLQGKVPLTTSTWTRQGCQTPYP